MRTAADGFKGGAPATRVRTANTCPVNTAGSSVLYWMVAYRRSSWNFALDRAVAWAAELRLPLVVLEALRVNYPWASDRLHRFVIDGMEANQRAFSRTSALYYPYLEPRPFEGRGLVPRLAADAAVIVTDDWPCFFLPHAIAAAARQVKVRLELVDSNGLIPMSVADRAFTAAVHFRRHVQRGLVAHLVDSPARSPFAKVELPRLSGLARDVTSQWPPASDRLLHGAPELLAAMPIDHSVPVVADLPGGSQHAQRALISFVKTRLPHYVERRNHPDLNGTSRLSPYLHFGHVSSHEVFDAVMRSEKWNIGMACAKATGLREGWWGVGKDAEAFLDQLVTWRELGFNTCFKRPDDYSSFDSLPGWALETLAAHAEDARPVVYDRDTFERGQTHDALWNAAQHEMVRDGYMHNYMRMLWAKKILEWSATPREALDTMTALMNKWSIDGRDPNSYAGYFWTLGRYDRPWPERPIYGTVRSMSSQNTARKVQVKRYVADRERGVFE